MEKSMEVVVIAVGAVSAVEIYANNGMDPLLGKIKEHVLSCRNPLWSGHSFRLKPK